MKSSVLSLALILSLSSCGSRDNQSADAKSPEIAHKSEAKLAEEKFDSMEQSLDQAGKCKRLKEIADLYYNEGDKENFEWTNSRSKVACAGL